MVPALTWRLASWYGALVLLVLAPVALALLLDLGPGAALGALLASGFVGLLLAVLLALRFTRPLRRLARLKGSESSAPWAEAARAGDLEALARSLRWITSRLERARDEGLRERERLEAVLRHASDGLVLVEGDGRVELVNESAERMLGAHGLRTTGRALIELLPDHDLVEVAKRAARGEIGREVRLVAGPRGRAILRATVACLREGQATKALLVLQDVTELQRLEAVRQEFVANVSHELRTPLASVKMMVETLQETDGEDPALERDLLARINLEVDKLTQLVRELLQLSEIESGRERLRRQWLHVGPLLERSAQRLTVHAERKQVALSVDAPNDLSPVHVDPDRIEQVMINLLQNALSFTPSGGSVKVTAATREDELVVSVRDTGQGILAEDLPRLFERFYKTDKSRHSAGMGLGLAIAKHLVQAHGGRIWAESAGPGQGATFAFSLPLAPASATGTADTETR